MEMNVAMVLAGGPAIFLLGSGLFRWMTCGDAPVSHAIGFALIGIVAVTFWEGPPVALSAATSLALCFVGAWERIRRRRVHQAAARPAH
jgi:low temperature requirement protein LtrA